MRPGGVDGRHKQVMETPRIPAGMRGGSGFSLQATSLLRHRLAEPVETVLFNPHTARMHRDGSRESK
ncbi:hypothetical protein GCM10023096_39860 [Nonomuraea ferruginea]